MHGEENGLCLAGYGEFFKSLFALWSIGDTNNGGLEASVRESGRWKEEKIRRRAALTGNVSPLFTEEDMAVASKVKTIVFMMRITTSLG